MSFILSPFDKREVYSIIDEYETQFDKIKNKIDKEGLKKKNE